MHSGGVGPAMAHGVFRAGSGFRVGWREGGGHWAIALWGLDTFVIFPDFLTSLKSFGNS